MLQRKAERKTGKGLVPYVSLKRYRLNKGFSEIIPDEISNTHRLIPLDLIGDILTIGAVRMPDEKIIERLKAHTGFRVQIMLITASDFDQYAQRAYNLSIVCGDKWIGDTKLGRYIKMPSYRGRERRRFRRFDKRIKIKYESRDEYNINSTVNISQGGVLIKSKSPISINSHLVARMTLPTSHQEVIIVSRVVRVEHIRSEDIYLIALHFSSMDIEDSRRLIRFIKSLKG